ncbi:hypothetical protein GW931_01560 [archaeon]|nr:hypothetical protein [archaeon]
MFKKGELTTQQIVILIILVVSFAVILFFIFRLNLGKETEQDICHNSVITRGKSILPTDTFPLQCKREYLCLSVDGSCEVMTKPDVIKVETKDEIYQALADQLAECWWMFGEGKVNYVGSEVIPDLQCSICDMIAFDDSVKKEIFNGTGEFDKKELYNYLDKTKRADGQTYLDYLNLRNFLSSYSGDYGKINLDKQYYSLMGITSDVSTWGWIWRIGAGAGLVAGGLALTPLTGGASGFGAAALLTGAKVAVAGGVVTGLTGGVLVAAVVRGQSGNEYVPSWIVEVNSPEFKALNCDQILTSS